MYDSWGSSWAGAWAQSWVHQTQVVVIDTHDDVKRINEYKRRREELHETILRAFEDVTGEPKIPTVEQLVEVQKARPAERKALTRIKEEVNELDEINQHILMLSKQLQQREMDDIAFIVSLL